MAVSPATLASFRLVDSETLMRQRNAAARNYARSVADGFPNETMLDWFVAQDDIINERVADGTL